MWIIASPETDPKSRLYLATDTHGVTSQTDSIDLARRFDTEEEAELFADGSEEKFGVLTVMRLAEATP